MSPAVQYVKFNIRRAFGIELEVSKKVSLDTLTRVVQRADPDHECRSSAHYQQDSGNKYWHCKFDRSCGSKAQEGGWEVASFKASGAKDLLKISKMGKMLASAGAEINDNCGYHIHVEIMDFNANQAATMMAFWMKIESIICEILPKSRRNNAYCKLLNVKHSGANKPKHLATAETFWVKVRPQSYDNSERRVSLNMCNFALGNPAKRTVELRLPEGTLCESDIKNWARMFIHFVNFNKNALWPGNVSPVGTLRETATILGLHGQNPFLLLSKGLYETKIWFFERVLKYSDNRTLKAEAKEFLEFLAPPVADNIIHRPICEEPKPIPPKKRTIPVKKPAIRVSDLYGDENIWGQRGS